GLVSGVLAVFTIAISTFPIKYKILLFIPVWTLLNCLGMIKQLFPQIPVDTTYNIYLQMYDSGPKSELAYLSIVCSIALISICLFCWNARKDWLQ
ncbi:MAG: hypothetical protein Q4F21_00655, partial [Lachnospiraceae bacterium]|nr:hypothetical protein [Lachnospiraceae bacterium]